MLSWWKNRRRALAASEPAADVPGAPVERTTGEVRLPALYDLVAVTMTDVGCRRSVNEDQVCYLPAGRPGEPDRGSLLIVADGMGGHVGGAVASQTAVAAVVKHYFASTRNDVHVALREALEAANREVFQEASRDRALQGMGTTCTALVLRGDHAFCAHAGDSRLYLLRDGRIYVMSEDHSLVMEMVKQGVLTQQEARHHEDKNIILRALGLRPSVEVSVWSQPLPVRVGDRFLVCSDGLYDLLEDEEIKDIVLAHRAHEACRILIARAKERGGYDNISVGLLQLDPLAEAGSRSSRATREITPLP